jgi:hypothetical protein
MPHNGLSCQCVSPKLTKLGLTARFTKCFRDYRNLSYVDYSVHELLAQRVYGIVLQG